MRFWPDAIQDDDRSTGYVIETLGDDVDKAHQRLTKHWSNNDAPTNAQYEESEARAYWRAVFAYIEGVTFSMKLFAALKLEDQKILGSAEAMIAAELTLEVKDGQIVEKEAKITLEESIKLAFKLTDSVHRKKEPTLDTSKQWWSDLKKAIKIRDRLTHPKVPTDLDISPDELLLILEVELGFRRLAGSYISKGTDNSP